LISEEESNERENRGHGGYMIYITDTTRMDCYENAMNYRCNASKANSYTNAYNTVTERGALINAKMK